MSQGSVLTFVKTCNTECAKENSNTANKFCLWGNDKMQDKRNTSFCTCVAFMSNINATLLFTSWDHSARMTPLTQSLLFKCK